MATLIVPSLADDGDWPTLGPLVCDFIEGEGAFAGRGLVFGPGDLRGDQARLDADKRALIYRIYQIFPRDHDLAGRRRFKLEVIELPKGVAKTELGAWVTGAELHSEGPVRCVGWTLERGEYLPVGGPVRDPYIPLVAFTEEQTEELGYGALYAILSESKVADDFNIGLERITRADGTGRAVALAGSPNARDGARTTFQWFDEPHRMFAPQLKKARTTMLANIPKRIAADAHTLDTSTRHDPGERSVHQDSYETAQLINAGKASDPTFFFFSRHATRRQELERLMKRIGSLSEQEDARFDKLMQEALTEASGSASDWRDFRSIIAQFRSPKADRAYLCRVYLNWTMRGAGKAFDVDLIESKLIRHRLVARGDQISLGFDGSRRRDATGLIATHLTTGWQWKAGVWERPADAGPDWEVPRPEVDAVVQELFDEYIVVWMNCDPEWWDETIGGWAGRYNRSGRHGTVVHEHYTNQPKKMGLEVRAYSHAIAAGEVTFDGDETFMRHLGNAHKESVEHYAEDGDQLYVIKKERRDSPLVIDLAMCGVLSWDAHLRALADGRQDMRKRSRVLVAH